MALITTSRIAAHTRLSAELQGKQISQGYRKETGGLIAVTALYPTASGGTPVELARGAIAVALGSMARRAHWELRASEVCGVGLGVAPGGLVAALCTQRPAHKPTRGLLQ